MSRFHSLVVKDITRETDACVSIGFDIPAPLKSAFQYKQGQYITFKLLIDGKEVRRSYSICSCPYTESELRVAVKQVPGGYGSVFLNTKVKEGSVLEVMEPMGSFYSHLDAAHQKHYILFAGGSGITPMMSIIKSVLHAEPKSRISLFYGNTSESAIIFKEQLKQIASKNEGRLNVYHILENPPAGTDPLLHGMLVKEKTEALLKQYITDLHAAEIFICGPTPMMQQTELTLKNLAVPAGQIHLEYFSAPASTDAPRELVSKKAHLTIVLDGDRVETELLPGESVLDAALRLNLDAPYACQGGSCCTCRAKLTKGEVEMKVNHALLDSEVKEGFILTCQSYALSDDLVVDYDRGR